MTEPFDKIRAFYDAKVAEFGHDPRAADYSGPAPQLTKFRVLSEVAPLANRSVLDVGCGSADWAGFLEGRSPGVRYSGIDLSPEMVRVAQTRRPDLDVRVGNVLDPDVGGPYDIVASNGIFYLLEATEAEDLMQRLVTRMFDLCSVALAFTTLSAWGGRQDSGEFYADPMTTLGFCRSLSPWVVLRHDYHERDFAIYVYRDRQL